MNQDQIERDRLLSEVHANVKHIVNWSISHDKKDDERFKSIDESNRWRDKVLYGAIGIAGFIGIILKFLH